MVEVNNIALFSKLKVYKLLPIANEKIMKSQRDIKSPMYNWFRKEGYYFFIMRKVSNSAISKDIALLDTFPAIKK